jgi:hypothetical protein
MAVLTKIPNDPAGEQAWFSRPGVLTYLDAPILLC